MQKKKFTRPPLHSLACVNQKCELYGQKNQDNLIIRKIYGKEKIRYLKCRTCQEEFSERKGTALWNVKIPEKKAISVAEHLGEGCSFKSTARLVRVDPDTVRRLNRRFGVHAEAFHDERAVEVKAGCLQADERWGFAVNKQHQVWEAEVIDPASKFVLSHVQGPRNKETIRRLLEDSARRLFNKHDLALFTDGEKSYASLFPEIFGIPHPRERHDRRGRPYKMRYRIPRSLCHVQIVKSREGKMLKSIKTVYRHGTKKRAMAALLDLHYNKANTSAIERRNGTARLMSSVQNRKTLAFSRHSTAKLALGWWTTTVYNWCRSHRTLRTKLEQYYGGEKYMQRSPAMAVGIADEVLLEETILKTQVFQRCGGR